MGTSVFVFLSPLCRLIFNFSSSSNRTILYPRGHRGFLGLYAFLLALSKVPIWSRRFSFSFLRTGIDLSRDMSHRPTKQRAAFRPLDRAAKPSQALNQALLSRSSTTLAKHPPTHATLIISSGQVSSDHILSRPLTRCGSMIWPCTLAGSGRWSRPEIEVTSSSESE